MSDSRKRASAQRSPATRAHIRLPGLPASARSRADRSRRDRGLSSVDRALRAVDHRLRALDHRLQRRWTRRQPKEVDRALVKLTEAADHSVLWIMLAAAGAVLGGNRGRRAAAYGLTALMFTSATVNGPLKLLFARRRPKPHRWIRRMPRTTSFPSGHAASAFAFAVAVSRELPEAGPALLPLAAGVAYSRVYVGVHYPSDVLAGAAFGAVVGASTRTGIDRLRRKRSRSAESSAEKRPSEAVLIFSPHSGRSRKLGRARRYLDRDGIQVAEELPIEDLDRLPGLLRSAAGEERLVIAAGGDGTVGAVAGRLVDVENPLGILPLGTGNDFARSVGIPTSSRRAAKTIATGEVTHVDLGRVTRDGQSPTYFAHAATVGLNVDFAKLATRASVRARLGRLTYLVASVYALRERSPFTCVLRHEGQADEMTLLQLSVISAPVIGGSVGLSVRNPHTEDHRLDVLAVEDVAPGKLLRAGAFLLLGIQRQVAGMRAMQVDRLTVDAEHPLGLSLDGELDGNLPGRFEEVPEAIGVLTPRQT